MMKTYKTKTRYSMIALFIFYNNNKYIKMLYLEDVSFEIPLNISHF